MRAVSHPYPGAFTPFGRARVRLADAPRRLARNGARPGKSIIEWNRLSSRAGGRHGSLEVLRRPAGRETEHDGAALVRSCAGRGPGRIRPLKVLILGVNGFIGNALTERFLTTTDWEVFGLDMADRQDRALPRQPPLPVPRGRHRDQQGMDRVPHQEMRRRAAARRDRHTRRTYVRDPLAVFELDFEENLRVVQQCVRYGKRVIFPSTSEVYGMCPDAEFDEDRSTLVYGPIHKQRWIYSTSKQLLDRVIFAYGQSARGSASRSSARSTGSGRTSTTWTRRRRARRASSPSSCTTFSTASRSSSSTGGRQRRSFTYIPDGIDWLMRIIASENGVADGEIFNLGIPRTTCPSGELAEVAGGGRALSRATRRPPNARRSSTSLGGGLLRRRLPGHRDAGAVDPPRERDARLGAADRLRHGAADDAGFLSDGRKPPVP